MKNVYEFAYSVSPVQRAGQKNQLPVVYWLTGHSGAGKSTLANRVEVQLMRAGYHTMIIDGDNLRGGLCADLSFNDEDRVENIRRAAYSAAMLADAGLIVLVCLISPFAKEREKARMIIGDNRFYEVHIDCAIEQCIKRDVKGLYKKAIEGEIPRFTGISSPYEAPQAPDVYIETARGSTQSSVELLVEHYLMLDNNDYTPCDLIEQGDYEDTHSFV